MIRRARRVATTEAPAGQSDVWARHRPGDCFRTRRSMTMPVAVRNIIEPRHPTIYSRLQRCLRFPALVRCSDLPPSRTSSWSPAWCPIVPWCACALRLSTSRELPRNLGDGDGGRTSPPTATRGQRLSSSLELHCRHGRKRGKNRERFRLRALPQAQGSLRPL